MVISRSVIESFYLRVMWVLGHPISSLHCIGVPFVDEASLFSMHTHSNQATALRQLGLELGRFSWRMVLHAGALEYREFIEDVDGKIPGVNTHVTK